jgi:hypothetical protein
VNATDDNDTAFTVVPWQSGQANVTHRSPAARAPMTELAKGRGPVRYSADRTFRYVTEDGRTYVRHMATGLDLTDRFGYFTSIADGRRFTADPAQVAEALDRATARTCEDPR